ncbi:hypothetical protein F8388_013146 [Cannabis sativa]|uniref:Uncharacterized protein n=1 Tax=Cannabis sativa TaxID=3483 RepID=A0A7J6HL59_CANSA|nr:hypothetical protein F8388_013146 [Cannabis sativa]
MLLQPQLSPLSSRCILHNFAGNIEMYGILDAIASRSIDARTSENSTMANVVGVGMSMEGIKQNPIVYDLMSEMAFLHKIVDVKLQLTPLLGNYDIVQQPKNVSDLARKNVHFYMFIDEETETYLKIFSVLESGNRIGLWRIL